MSNSISRGFRTLHLSHKPLAEPPAPPHRSVGSSEVTKAVFGCILIHRCSYFRFQPLIYCPLQPPKCPTTFNLRGSISSNWRTKQCPCSPKLTMATVTTFAATGVDSGVLSSRNVRAWTIRHTVTFYSKSAESLHA